MAATVAWVLNLDADFELANCGPWEPSQALKEVLETHALQSRDEKQLLQELPAKMLHNALHIPQIIDQKNNRQTQQTI